MNILEQIDSHINSLVIYITSPESLENHKHTKGQLTFFEGGSSHLYTENSNYFVPTHHFAWIPANKIHRFVHFKKKDICVRTFYLPETFTNHPIFNEVGIYNSNALMLEIFRHMPMGELFPNHPSFDFFMAYIKLLPSLISDKLSIFLPISKHQIIQQIVTYILTNLSDSLTINETANKFNLGSKTFARLFLNEVGMTFHQYVKNARIMKSIELILENKLSINQIAYEVGYSSIASFSNSFYQLTHKRPSSFK